MTTVERPADGSIVRRLGTALQRARVRKGLTQEEVAATIGVHPITLSKYERGRNRPNLTTLQRLAELYEVPVEAMLQPALDGAARVANTVDIAIKGWVSAGIPQDSYETDLGGAALPDFVVKQHPRAFLLTVSGDSLEEDGIHDRDLLLVDPASPLLLGKLYVLRTGSEFCARHVVTEEGRVVLRAANEAYEDLAPDRVELIGRVVWHLRQM